jgi:hypothetical protein
MKWKFKEWIRKDKLKWDYLSLNPHPQAIKMLEENLDKINWNFLSENPEAIHILFTNKDKINWLAFLRNPKIIYMNDYFKILSNIKNLKINKTELSILMKNSNDDVVNCCLKYIPEHEINISSLCMNTNTRAIMYLKNIDKQKYDWTSLSINSSAVDILMNNINKINMHALACNINIIAFKHFEKYYENNMDKMIWNLEENDKAIGILEINKNNLHWDAIFANPEIFELDYNEIKKEMWKENGIKESLETYFYHPDRAHLSM